MRSLGLTRQEFQRVEERIKMAEAETVVEKRIIWRLVAEELLRLEQMQVKTARDRAAIIGEGAELSQYFDMLRALAERAKS